MHEPETGNRESRQRVLVIDDNEAFLRNTKTALAVAFEVETLHIGQGSRAEDIADRVVAFRPEQILLDVNLTGGFSSRDLLRALVERRVLDRCEVRLISFGFSSGQGRGGASQGGADSTPRGDGAGHAGDPGADALAPAEAVIASFQALSIRVKGPLIRKPIDAYDLMAALVGVDPFDPPDYWSDFPLPLRVLGRRRAPNGAWMCPVLYANPAWTRFGADPVQPSSSLFPDWRERGKVPEPLERIGNPFDPNYSSYVLRSFPIEQDGQELLGQVVEHRMDTAGGTGLDETITEVFEAMARVGFARGQCYLLQPLIQTQPLPEAGSVPAVEDGRIRFHSRDADEHQTVDTVITLAHVTANHGQIVLDRLPLRRPLRGVLKQRAEAALESLDTRKASGRTNFGHVLRSVKHDSAVRDDDLIWWSQQLWAGHESSLKFRDRLEVPIPAWSEDPITGKETSKPRLAAVLMFSRIGPTETTVTTTAGAAGATLLDAGLRLDENDVMPVLTVLTGLVERLRLAIFHEERGRFVAHQVCIHEIDQGLQAAVSPEQKKQQLMSAFQQVLNADHAVLISRPDGAQILKHDGSASRAGLTLPDCVNRVETRLDDPVYAVVNAWNQRHAFLTQSHSDSPAVKKVIHKYSASGSLDHAKWADWNEAHHGSVLVYPVAVDGRSIGVMVCYYTKPWSLTADLHRLIESLTQRARWLLQSIITERERRDWQLAIAHEMRRDLMIAQGGLAELSEWFGELPDDVSGEIGAALHRSRLGVEAGLNLAYNWTDHLLGIRVSESQTPFETITVIEEYLDSITDTLAERLIEVCWLTPKESPIWRTRLSHRDWFVRVIRVLIDNAVNFGRAHVDDTEDDEAPVVVSFGAALVMPDGGQANRLRITIINPGTMSEDECHTCFEIHRPTAVRRTDGAHFGLHIARKLARTIGGDIVLGCDQPASTVIAQLDWPLAPIQEHV